jgi:protein-disulfide isomerase
MNKRFLIILVGLVVAFAGLLFFNKKEAKAPENGGSQNKVQPTNHIVGKGTTGVKLTEYGDFQCPACYQFFPIVKQVKATYGDQITFQFRHFPLSQVHKFALLAARAGEAAGMQGKFFEMHDMLYTGQQVWSNSSNPTKIFEEYAKQLGLNVDQFRSDMESERVNDIVQADVAEGTKKGYDSTPSFEINGKKIQNPRDLESFKKLIDDAIAAKQKSSQQ